MQDSGWLNRGNGVTFAVFCDLGLEWSHKSIYTQLGIVIKQSALRFGHWVRVGEQLRYVVPLILSLSV